MRPASWRGVEKPFAGGGEVLTDPFERYGFGKVFHGVLPRSKIIRNKGSGSELEEHC